MHRENFPQLTDDNHAITSPPTWDYNCIAWSLGETQCWYSSASRHYYWPRGIGRNMRNVETIAEFYKSLGFEKCNSTSLEDGYEKVALYVIEDGSWRHVALQNADGTWTSKLGEHEDIRHDTAEILLGGEYASIATVLRRRRP